MSHSVYAGGASSVVGGWSPNDGSRASCFVFFSRSMGSATCCSVAVSRLLRTNATSASVMISVTTETRTMTVELPLPLLDTSAVSSEEPSQQPTDQKCDHNEGDQHHSSTLWSMTVKAMEMTVSMETMVTAMMKAVSVVETMSMSTSKAPTATTAVTSSAVLALSHSQYVGQFPKRYSASALPHMPRLYS